MGVEYWIVDHEKEVKVYLGKIGRKNIFEDYVQQVKDLQEVLYSDVVDIKNKIWEDYYDLNDTEVKNITIEQLSFLLYCKQIIEAIPNMDRGLFPFLYFINEIEQKNNDWDYVSDHQEPGIDEYGDYTELNSPYN